VNGTSEGHAGVPGGSEIVTAGGNISGDRPDSADARGIHIVRLHQTLEDWRDIRRCAYEQGWPPLASAIISIEIDLLERKIVACAGMLFAHVGDGGIGDRVIGDRLGQLRAHWDGLRSRRGLR
jgi:hypothetical protein